MIPLATMIHELNRQLVEAIEESSKEEQLRFWIQGVDLEVQVVAQATDEIKGGVNFFALEAGGGSRDTYGTIQTVRLKLLSYDPTRLPSREIAVGDRREVSDVNTAPHLDE